LMAETPGYLTILLKAVFRLSRFICQVVFEVLTTRAVNDLTGKIGQLLCHSFMNLKIKDLS
jgi:hypothetical protein